MSVALQSDRVSSSQLPFHVPNTRAVNSWYWSQNGGILVVTGAVPI